MRFLREFYFSVSALTRTCSATYRRDSQNDPAVGIFCPITYYALNRFLVCVEERVKCLRGVPLQRWAGYHAAGSRDTPNFSVLENDPRF
jgi:hypothetical protein